MNPQTTDLLGLTIDLESPFKAVHEIKLKDLESFILAGSEFFEYKNYIDVKWDNEKYTLSLIINENLPKVLDKQFDGEIYLLKQAR